jgi:hypothetical protein
MVNVGAGKRVKNKRLSTIGSVGKSDAPEFVLKTSFRARSSSHRVIGPAELGVPLNWGPSSSSTLNK